MQINMEQQQQHEIGIENKTVAAAEDEMKVTITEKKKARNSLLHMI